ncbi:MAG: sterol desaturase family protein [Leptospirales bacterium]
MSKKTSGQGQVQLESQRLFKSSVLEWFTHVHPSTPFIIYIPVIIVSIYGSFAWYDTSVLKFLLLLGIAMLFWTFCEYIIHRFLFHPPFSGNYLKWFYFYSHGIHHDFPNDTTRLVMPPLVSIPLATGFYLLFRSVLASIHMPFFAGFVCAYLIYDYLHYATHFHDFTMPWFKKLRKHHNVHHFTAPHLNYGVSNSFWDYIFFSKHKENE